MQQFLMLKEDGPTPGLSPRQMVEELLEEIEVLKEQIQDGRIEAIYKLVGRPGGALIINAESHEALFRRMTELPEFAYSMFEIELVPLSSMDAAIADIERALEKMGSTGTVESPVIRRARVLDRTGTAAK